MAIYLEQKNPTTFARSSLTYFPRIFQDYRGTDQVFFHQGKRALDQAFTKSIGDTLLTTNHAFHCSCRLSEDEDDLYQSDCRVHGASLLHEEEREALNPVAVDGHLSGGSSPQPPMGPGDLPPYDHSNCSTQLHKACACVNFIAEHTKAKEEATKVSGGEGNGFASDS